MSQYGLPGDGFPSETGSRSTLSTAAPSSGTPRIFVVDSDTGIRNRLAMQLGEQAVPLATVENLGDQLDGRPMVLVLGPTVARTPGLLGAEDLAHSRPEVGAILIAESPSTELFQRAIRSGVRDVLAAPVDTTQLNEAVRRVAISLGSVGRSSSGFTSGEDEPGKDGKVITVFSTKGGAGKSVVASNLAVILAGRSEKPVVLVDADLQFGDIAVMLKLAPQHTIVDVVGSIDRLDVGLLQSLLIEHPASGLFVLPAPLEPAFADQIGADQMHRIIQLLRTICEYIVVDTPAYFNDVVLGLMEDSDEVLLVAGMDIPNIKNVKIGLQTLRLLNTPMDKIHLVLNRANSKVKLGVSEVERTLQVKAECLIPSDIVVPQSVNKGAPVVLDAPKSGVTKAMVQLADLVSPAVEAKKRRW